MSELIFNENKTKTNISNSLKQGNNTIKSPCKKISLNFQNSFINVKEKGKISNTRHLKMKIILAINVLKPRTCLKYTCR